MNSSGGQYSGFQRYFIAKRFLGGIEQAMNKWPSTIPYDLDVMLNQLQLYRDAPRNSDVWGVLQEWLEGHGVEVPEDLPMRPEP